MVKCLQAARDECIANNGAISDKVKTHCSVAYVSSALYTTFVFPALQERMTAAVKS